MSRCDVLVPSAAGPNISLNGARLGACCRVGLMNRHHYVSFQSADPSSGASGFGPTHPAAQPAELGSHSHGLVNATRSPGQGFTWLCTRQPVSRRVRLEGILPSDKGPRRVASVPAHEI